MLKFGLILYCFALCHGHVVVQDVLPAVHSVHTAPVAASYPLHHGFVGHGLAGNGYGSHALGGHEFTGHILGGHGFTSHTLGSHGFSGHGIGGHGLIGHGIVGAHGYLDHGAVASLGNGHHLYKRSPHYVAPFEHVSHVDPIAHVSHVAPLAFSHQERVDVRSTPVVTPIVQLKPVLTSFIPAAPLYHNSFAGHYGGDHYGSAHPHVGHY